MWVSSAVRRLDTTYLGPGNIPKIWCHRSAKNHPKIAHANYKPLTFHKPWLWYFFNAIRRREWMEDDLHIPVPVKTGAHLDKWLDTRNEIVLPSEPATVQNCSIVSRNRPLGARKHAYHEPREYFVKVSSNYKINSVMSILITATRQHGRFHSRIAYRLQCVPIRIWPLLTHNGIVRTLARIWQ